MATAKPVSKKAEEVATKGKSAPAAKTAVAVPPKKEVAAPQSTEMAAMFEQDQGHGMEGATAESFAIPFLSCLQKSSPQVDEASGAAIEGAKSGMFFENVTGKMYDGKVGVAFVPCAYRRVFIRWGARGTSEGGFKGEMFPEEVAKLRSENKIVDLDGKLFFPLPDGTVNDKKCDRVSDTRNHYILLLDDEGGWTQALLSLTSTQIKKSKALMSLLGSVKFTSGSGQRFTPSTFANIVRVTSIPESNDKGTWHGVKFDLEGRVEDASLYEAARAFHGSVVKGAVEVKYEAPVETEGGGNGF